MESGMNPGFSRMHAFRVCVASMYSTLSLTPLFSMTKLSPGGSGWPLFSLCSRNLLTDSRVMPGYSLQLSMGGLYNKARGTRHEARVEDIFLTRASGLAARGVGGPPTKPLLAPDPANRVAWTYGSIGMVGIYNLWTDFHPCQAVLRGAQREHQL